MSQPIKPVINLADVPLRESDHGDAFKAMVGSFGKTIGSTGKGGVRFIGRPANSLDYWDGE